MRHPEFPVISFLSIFLLLLSSPSHIKARSVSTLALIAWMSVMHLIRGVNSLVWAGNVDLKLYVWCDITTKITVGSTFAIPAALLCILRHLECVASARNVHSMSADKRKRQIFEAIMCFGIPIIFMALHYIVQGHRFDMFEDYGCGPSTYISIAGLCLVYIPQLILSLVSLVYAALSVYHILGHRSEFASRLQSNSAISAGRYFRLMALATTVTAWDTGVNSYIISFNTHSGLRPWISWENVHVQFSRIWIYPASFTPPFFRHQLLFQWWILPVSSFAFFVFFGFGREAGSNYQIAITWFRHRVLRQSVTRETSSHGIAVLPSYRSRDAHVNVTLPYTSDRMPEAESWEKLVLEVPPDIKPTEIPSALVSKEPHQSSLHELSTSMIESRYASINKDLPLTPPSLSSGNHGHPAHSETVPSVTITKPSNAALRDDFSPATCPRPTFRQSMSHDFGITVSPLYLPDAGSASRYHEEAFLARDSQDTGPVPCRIQKTTEKSVV